MTEPPAPKLLGLFAGSPSPSNDEEVEMLLHFVPSFAFVPELETCLFDASALASVADLPRAEQVAALADSVYIERLRAALEAAKTRANADYDGGSLFLATILQHFLGAVPVAEHPAVVSLYCRSMLRYENYTEDPREVAALMDEYESAAPDSASGARAPNQPT
jgi:hypothetical protein